MKLTGQRLAAFLRAPDPQISAVLLYGPDRGLVRERADHLVVAVAGDASDPFRVAEVTVEQVKDDPARLADEAAALTLTGGRRVVRVRDAKDALADAVRNLLRMDGDAGGVVVIEAGELGPRSPLRATVEGADRAIAIACYLDEGTALRALIETDLKSHGNVASEDALDLLAGHLGADRALTRNELEKLILYKGGPGRIEAEDVLAVVAGAGTISLDALAFAACDGDMAALDRALAVASAEGLSPIPLLRVVARHLQRLLQARGHLVRGSSAKQAMDALKPGVFFRLQPLFRRQLEQWDENRLARAMTLVTTAELECKRTGAPQGLLCHRALMRVASLAGHRDETRAAAP